MDKPLQNKIAIVTGSTAGIGEGIVRRFAAEGAKVVVSGLEKKTGERIAASIRLAGGEAVFQFADLRKPEHCKALIRRAVDEFGGLDVLVNNAGIYPHSKFEETTADFWDTIFEINARGVFLCVQAAAPAMRARGGGSIINIGSCCAFQHYEGLFAYGATKGTLYHMTMAMARKFAPDHIRANWITVGWVPTENERKVEAAEGHDEAWYEQARQRLPGQEFQTVDDVAAGCVFLAGGEARQVTGSDLRVTGGQCVRF
ncbi:MAG: glucose 1-dehydrogenase [Candidatus Sumerlaeota bacterium]|nr:glucose 1-dehydrogenase [Candidatus Sumerlaeota bacterium]